MRRVVIALLFSVLIHFVTFEGVYRLPVSPINSALRDTLEFTLEDPEDKLAPKIRYNKQIVMDALVPKNVLSEDDDFSKYLSKKRQRVKEESKASRTGLTLNQLLPFNPLRPVVNQQDGKAKAFGALKKKSDSFGDKPKVNKVYGQGGQSKNSSGSEAKAVSAKTVNMMGSQVNETLDNVKIGDFTALNTDQFTFYTFYSRVNAQIRFHWEKNVELAIAEATAFRPHVPRLSVWDSQITVFLNSGGYFVEAQVDRSCGLASFDRAAIAAFKAGSPILNPPKELVQDDGLIHLHYEFRVYWTPQILGRANTQ